MKESSYNRINQFLVEAEAPTPVISTPNIEESIELEVAQMPEASTDAAIRKYQLTVDTYFNTTNWKMVPKAQDIYKIDHGKFAMAYIQQVNILGEIRYVQVITGQALRGRNFTESDTGNLISGSMAIAYVEDAATQQNYFELNGKVVQLVPCRKVNESKDQEAIEKARAEGKVSIVHSQPEVFVPAGTHKKKKRKLSSEINNALNLSVDEISNIANLSQNAVTSESDAYFLQLIDQSSNNNNTHSLVGSLWQRPVLKKYLLTENTYFNGATNKLVPPGQEISVIRNKDSVLSFIESYDENNNLCYMRVRSGKAMRGKEFIRPNGESVLCGKHKIVYVDDSVGPYFEWNGEKLNLNANKLTYKPQSDLDMGARIIEGKVETITSQVELLTAESFVRHRRSKKQMSS